MLRAQNAYLSISAKIEAQAGAVADLFDNVASNMSVPMKTARVDHWRTNEGERASRSNAGAQER